MGKLNDMFGGQSNGCLQIISLMFKARNDAHITHLLQPDRTLALHTAMEKFYDGTIISIADDIYECYSGLYGVQYFTVDKSECIENPVNYFKSLYNAIDTARKEVKESFIQNLIDSLQEEVAHTLYRLNNIKS